MSYQVGEVRDARQCLADDELEGDGGEQEDETQLKSVLRQVQLNRKCSKGKTADEKLKSQPKHPYIKQYFAI